MVKVKADVVSRIDGVGNGKLQPFKMALRERKKTLPPLSYAYRIRLSLLDASLFAVHNEAISLNRLPLPSA